MSLMDCDLDLIKFTLQKTRKELKTQVLINEENKKKISQYEEKIESLYSELKKKNSDNYEEKINKLWEDFKEQKEMYETKIKNLESLLEIQKAVN